MKTTKLEYSKNTLKINTGFDCEKDLLDLSVEYFFSFKKLDDGSYIIHNVVDSQFALIKGYFLKIDSSKMKNYLEISRINDLVEELKSGLDLLTSLTPSKIGDYDSILIAIDDITSTEERFKIFQNAILESFSLNPMIDKTVVESLSALIENMAMSQLTNTDKLDYLIKNEIDPNLTYENATEKEKMLIKQISLLNFLIDNSENYINHYKSILEKANSIISE